MPEPHRRDAPPDWDARYADEGFLFGTEPNAFLVAHRHLIPPGGRVLCVADDEGAPLTKRYSGPCVEISSSATSSTRSP